MTARPDRSGFTLMETMVASSIAVIVLAAVAGTFIFCQRMFRVAMEEAESSLALRTIRDRLLFHSGPGLNDGLLTGKATADNAAITMDWEDPDDGPGNMRLVWRSDQGGGKYFFNERVAHTPVNIAWFKPGGFTEKAEWTQTVDLPRIKIELTGSDGETVLGSTWILLPQ